MCFSDVISLFQIILSLLLPPAIFLLEFKSKAEMCHVPQSHEAILFGLDSVKSVPANEGTDHMVKCQSCTFPALFVNCNWSPSSLSVVFLLPCCSFSPILTLLSQGSQDAEQGLPSNKKSSASQTISAMAVHCLSWITRVYEFYTAPVVKFWFHTVGGVHVVVLKTHHMDGLRVPPCL